MMATILIIAHFRTMSREILNYFEILIYMIRNIRYSIRHQPRERIPANRSPIPEGSAAYNYRNPKKTKNTRRCPQ
jgi:hypothetical protein